MLSSISKLIKELDKQEIRYCHWKSNEHLCDALNGDTDLDILFDPVDRVSIEKIFDCCGLKRFRATPLMQYNAIEDFIGFDESEAKIWHVHTHYRMTLGEKHLKGYTINPWGKRLLETRVRGEENVWTASPFYEYVILLSRIALKLRWRDTFQKISKGDCAEIAWLRGRINKEEISAAASCLLGEKSKRIVLRLFEKGFKRKRQLVPLQKTLRREMKMYSSYNRISSWFARTRREVFWFIGGIKRRLGLSCYSAKRRISPSGGLVVAFLGSDGAGKSTTIEYVRKEFGKKIDVVSLYFGSGDGSSSLLRKPMKLVAKRVGGKGVGHAAEREYAERKHISFKTRLYSIARVFWAIELTKEKKKKYRKMIKARNNGLLVLTDRYPQSDTPGASDGPLLYRYRSGRGLLNKLSCWEQRIYESFSLNGPDLAIKLVVSSEIAIKRKPEMTIEEIEKKRSIVMNLEVAERSAVIDTSQSFEVTRSEVMKEIWDQI